MGESNGSINNTEVGKRIKEVRMANKLTQEQMAEMLKVTPNAVRDYEKGNYGISKDVMLLMKQRFNVSIDYLLFGENTEREKIVTMIDNLSEENKMQVFIYLWTYFVTAKRKGSVKDINIEQTVGSLKQLLKDEQIK